MADGPGVLGAKELGIGPGLSVRNGQGRFIDLLGKRRSIEAVREVESLPRSGEVFLDLGFPAKEQGRLVFAFPFDKAKIGKIASFFDQEDRLSIEAKKEASHHVAIIPSGTMDSLS